MGESEGIQEVVNQAAIQVATVVMMTLRGVAAGPYLAQAANLREPQQQRHGRLALIKPSFDWNVQDRYIELLNFKVEIMSIVEMKTYGLSEDRS